MIAAPVALGPKWFEFAMKSLLTAALLLLAPLAGAASAATVTPLDMKQNDWVVFDLRSGPQQIKITPLNTNGSFSYSLGFADSLCPQSWACKPEANAFDTVYGSGGDFGYGWDTKSFSFVVSEVLLTPLPSSLYMFFRVTSGTASVAKLGAGAVTPIAPVPLPAPALLLLAGLGGLFALRRFRKAA